MPKNLLPFHLDGLKKRLRQKEVTRTAHLPVERFFKQAPFVLTSEQIATKPLALQEAAKDALRYIKRHEATSIHIVDPVNFSAILSLELVKKTLQFIVQIIEEDKKTGVFRILNPKFLNKHFSSIAWIADKESAERHAIKLPDNKSIRLTTYAVFNAQGRREKSEEYNCGLYALNDDNIAKRFTKQEIIAGALDEEPFLKKRTPLAWVTRDVLEDATMNGTVLITLPDDGSRLLNVHKNNGHVYDKRLTDRRNQRRYWFFKDIGTQTHEAKHRLERIKQRDNVIFAGDLQNIGLGKLIALRHLNPKTNLPELRLGILADTGNAFRNNLYQLDYFAGLVQGPDELREIIRQRPTFSKACILYKRERKAT